MITLMWCWVISATHTPWIEPEWLLLMLCYFVLWCFWLQVSEKRTLIWPIFGLMLCPSSDLHGYLTSLLLLQKQTIGLSLLLLCTSSQQWCTLVVWVVLLMLLMPIIYLILTCVSACCCSGWQKYRFTKQSEFLNILSWSEQNHNYLFSQRYENVSLQKTHLTEVLAEEFSNVFQSLFNLRDSRLLKHSCLKRMLCLQRTLDLCSSLWVFLFGKQNSSSA